MSDIQEIIRKVVSKVPDSQVMADLDAAVEFVRTAGKGDTERLRITGFAGEAVLCGLFGSSAWAQGSCGLVRTVYCWPYSSQLTPKQPRRCSRESARRDFS